MIPSLPTLSIASAIIAPIDESLFAEMVAICSISLDVLIGFAIFSNSPTTIRTASSIPLFKSIGFAPAVTFLIPNEKISCARTVAVVVPSPAWSAVLEATSFTNCAPMFSIGSSNSISFATDTPSFVIWGTPNCFCRITFLPFGPSVTFTAFANLSTPSFNPLLTSVSNLIIFAI